jgi:hypothetical protein
VNFKAWDNEASAYGLPFRLLLVKSLWEIMDPHDKRSEGLAYPLTTSSSSHIFIPITLVHWLDLMDESAVSCGCTSPGASKWKA